MEVLTGGVGKYAACLKERSHGKCIHCGFQFNLESSENKQKYACILPCWHSLCFSCVESNVDHKSIQCPICDYKCFVGEDAISVLPKNKGNLQYDSKECFAFCSICGSKPEFFCRSCNLELCQTCKNEHFQKHKRHDVIASHSREIHESFCDVHKKNPLKYFCSNCKESICQICKGQTHCRHRVKELKTKNDYFRLSLIGILRKIKMLKTKVGNNITDTRHHLKDLLNALRLPRSNREDSAKNDIDCLHHSSRIYILLKMIISLEEYKKRLEIGENLAEQKLYKEDPILLDTTAPYIIFNLHCLVLEFGNFENYRKSQRFRTELNFLKTQSKATSPESVYSGKHHQSHSAGATNFMSKHNTIELTDEMTELYNCTATKDTTIHKTVTMNTELFPNVQYLLLEANFSVTHMEPVISDIQSCACNLLGNTDLGLIANSVEPKRLLIIVNEIRSMKFRRNDVQIRLIGDESEAVMLKSLTDLERSVTDGKLLADDIPEPQSFEMDTLYICWQKDIGAGGRYFKTKVLDVLKSMRSYYLQNVIFITRPDEAIKKRVTKYLQSVFPDTFAPGLKCPKLSTPEQLSTILANVLLDNMYDLIETLASVVDTCLDDFTGDGTKRKEYKEEIFERKLHILQEAKLDLKSLIQERPSKKSSRIYLRSVPTEVQEGLQKLKDMGLMGYSMHKEEFLAFVDKDAENFDFLEKEVRSIVSQHQCNCKFFLSPKPMFKQFISNGDKIIPGTPENEGAVQIRERYGTLGAFARNVETSRLLALTSGHVAQVNQDVSTHDGKKLGTCIEGPRGNNMCLTDLAVVQIDEIIESECDPVYQKENQRFNLRRFQGRTCDLAHDQRVFKVGAKTGVTRGKIDLQYMSTDSAGVFIFVKGFYKPFADKGDSGAFVCMKEDGNPTDVTALTMVTGGDIQLEEKYTPGTSATTRPADYTCTFMINDELDKIKEKLPIEYISKD